MESMFFITCGYKMLKVYIFKDLKNLEHCYASICQKSGSSEHVLAYILTITKLSTIQISLFYFEI